MKNIPLSAKEITDILEARKMGMKVKEVKVALGVSEWSIYTIWNGTYWKLTKNPAIPKPADFVPSHGSPLPEKSQETYIAETKTSLEVGLKFIKDFIVEYERLKALDVKYQQEAERWRLLSAKLTEDINKLAYRER